jgi:hypothetical protein
LNVVKLYTTAAPGGSSLLVPTLLDGGIPSGWDLIDRKCDFWLEKYHFLADSSNSIVPAVYGHL